MPFSIPIRAMCLCPNAHGYHESAFFALEDNKRLKVQFYHPPKYKHWFPRAPIITENEDGKLHEIWLWNVTTDQRICSEDVIDPEMNDSKNPPLPDLRLLDMQWMLNRVSALSGATEPRDDNFNEDDGD